MTAAFATKSIAFIPIISYNSIYYKQEDNYGFYD